MRVRDLTGERFGRLVVVGPAVLSQVLVSQHRRTHWRCRCDCGTERIVQTGNLTHGNTRSCGCLRKEVTSQRKLKPTEQVIVRQIWNYYQRNARMRNLSWGLTLGEFQTLILGRCYYCGIRGGTTTTATWAVRSGERSMENNSVDRLDSSIGYTPENSVTACKDCNLGKHEKTPDQFLAWVRRLVAHQNALSQIGGA